MQITVTLQQGFYNKDLFSFFKPKALPHDIIM